MHHLNIDLETFSSIPIRKAGLHRYVESPDFEILLFGYSFDGAPVRCVDLAQGEAIPADILAALTDPNCLKHAYNAAFEWYCLSRYLRTPLPPPQWRDTRLHSLYAGYPVSLDAAGKAIGLPEDKRKLKTGKDLIRYFSVPCKPTRANGGRTRNLPRHDPDKWRLFKEYNAQDVVTEMEIDTRLSEIVVPDWVQREWERDLISNARGVAVDMDLVDGALEIGADTRKSLMEEATRISGLDNPNSIKKLATWLEAETGEVIGTVRKEDVAQLLSRDGNSPEVRRMLEIRQELGKTSTKKYNAIEIAVCDDGRVRGLLLFYGANRTGRWAGRLVQVQNLPRTYTEPLDLARELVKKRKADALRVIYGSVPDTLSQLIRTAFVAAPGHVLIDADFSAIEARVISWLAGEEWRLDVFRNGGDIYCASASQMFGVPVVKHGENGHLRQKGKVAELACGYQGGIGAMKRMGGEEMGLSDTEMQEIVDNWRAKSPKIVKLWYDVQRAAVTVIANGGSAAVNGILFSLEWNTALDTAFLTITLPSGRKLYYNSPKTVENQWGGASISYMGMDQGSKQWKRIETYGGKLVENIVQAVARDCLATAIGRLEAAGMRVIFHIHDEVVIEAPEDAADYDKTVRIMSQPIPWAKGLPLDADGWVGMYFKKD